MRFEQGTSGLKVQPLHQFSLIIKLKFPGAWGGGAVDEWSEVLRYGEEMNKKPFIYLVYFNREGQLSTIAHNEPELGLLRQEVFLLLSLSAMSGANRRLGHKC